MTDKKPYRLLVVAPAGIHLRTFLDRVKGATTAIHLVSNQTMEPSACQGQTIVDFSLRKPVNFFRTVRRIREACQRFKPDVVHVHQINSVAYYAVRALKDCGVPIAVTAWGSDILVNPRRRAWMRRMVRYVLMRADAFTSDSRYMAAQMQALVPERHLEITVCNFGVNPPKITRPKEDIIYSNRLHKPLYRIDKILRAFAVFVKSQEGSNWRLVVAATGTETEQLRQTVRELDMESAVSFVGWLDKSANEELYARAKVWASVPESDATAVSLLEAMYHGCYPVVSDLPASREWIQDGENGRIVADPDTPFFAGISSMDFESVGKANIALMSNAASASISSQKFTSLHRKLLRRPGEEG